MNVIVIGGGKVGFYLCKTLLEHGHQPLIIEKNKRTCEYAANQLDIAVVNADGSTIEALTTANASRADAVIAVTGLDQDNLISCQLAKRIFKVPKTVARVIISPVCLNERWMQPASSRCFRSTAVRRL